MLSELEVIGPHGIERAIEGRTSHAHDADDAPLPRPRASHARQAESLTHRPRLLDSLNRIDDRRDPPHGDRPIAIIGREYDDIPTHGGYETAHQSALCEFDANVPLRAYAIKETRLRTGRSFDLSDVRIQSSGIGRLHLGGDPREKRIETRSTADRFIHSGSVRVDSARAGDMQCTSDSK